MLIFSLKEMLSCAGLGKSSLICTELANNLVRLLAIITRAHISSIFLPWQRKKRPCTKSDKCWFQSTIYQGATFNSRATKLAKIATQTKMLRLAIKGRWCIDQNGCKLNLCHHNEPTYQNRCTNVSFASSDHSSSSGHGMLYGEILIRKLWLQNRRA